MNNKSVLQENIRKKFIELRKNGNYTLGEFARILGVLNNNPSQVFFIESGQRPIRPEHIYYASQYFNIPINEFYES